jgi:hypothetical protein
MQINLQLFLIYFNFINKNVYLDHIISIKTGKTVDDLIKLNHYSNLQPLCSYVNRFVKK